MYPAEGPSTEITTSHIIPNSNRLLPDWVPVFLPFHSGPEILTWPPEWATPSRKGQNWQSWQSEKFFPTLTKTIAPGTKSSCQRRPVLKPQSDASPSAQHQRAGAKKINEMEATVPAASSLTCALGTTHAQVFRTSKVLTKPREPDRMLQLLSQFWGPFQ